MSTGSDHDGPKTPSDTGPAPVSSDPAVNKIVAEAVAAAPPPQTPPAVDEQRLLANRYRLQDLLGRGSMGAVWRAHDVILRRSVAVKEVLLPPTQTAEDNEIARERALREARAIAALSHPNVVTLFDVVEEDGRPWVVMELVPAKSLAEILRDSGPLNPTEAARIGLAVLGALDAAHQVGITHRDVKPGNILVSSDGRVKLADFGISRKIDESQLTRTGLMVGSPSYIAPEVARGKEAGRPADIWGLGATLHCAVEGTPPFDLGDPVATLTAVVGEPPRPAPHAGPLGPVIERALIKDPRQRIQVDELRRMLSDISSRPSERSMTIPVRTVQPRSAPQRPVRPPNFVPTPPQQARGPQSAGYPQQSAGGPQHQRQPVRTGPPSGQNRAPQRPASASIPMQARPQGAVAAPPKKTSGWLIAAIVAVLALGAAVVIVVINNQSGTPNGQGGGQSGSAQVTTSPPSPPPSSPPGPTGAAVPVGISLAGDAKGSVVVDGQPRPFSVKLPAGWQPGVVNNSRVEFQKVAGAGDPASLVKATIVAGSLGDQSVEEAIEALKGETGSPDALPEFDEKDFESDDDTVIWEYTNEDQGQKRAGIMYAVGIDGVLWRVFLTSPLSQRGQLKQIADTAIASFSSP